MQTPPDARCAVDVQVACSATWQDLSIVSHDQESTHVLWLGPAGCSGRECAAAPDLPQDRRFDDKQLKVAQFNVEWLFYEAGSSKCPGSGCTWLDGAAATEHFDEIADLIRSLDADIVHLTEVVCIRSLARSLARALSDHIVCVALRSKTVAHCDVSMHCLVPAVAIGRSL
jgi:hypothetical protein